MSDDKTRHVKDEALDVKERTTTKKPKLYRVLLHNDDYTTMEFVVVVLMELFKRTRTEATQVMLHVHTRGQGICGVYPHDIAETKVTRTVELAREHGHPLMCSMEPE